MTNIDSYRIRKINHVIYNSKSIPEVRQVLETFGYNEKKLSQGESLKRVVLKAIKHRTDAYNAYHDGVEYYNRIKKEANSTLVKYVQLARIILRNKEELTPPAQCKKSMLTKLEEWLLDAEGFYQSVLSDPAWLEGFMLFNISKEKLEAGLKMVTETQEANSKKIDKHGLAKEATRMRDIALKEAENWCSAVLAVARISLGQNSRHYKALSI
jgi:hypothetical protein